MAEMLVPGPPVGPRADGQQRVTQFFKRKDPEVTAAAPAPPTEAQQRAAAEKRAADTAADLAQPALTLRLRRLVRVFTNLM